MRFVETFAAGESKQFVTPGRYFRIVRCLDPVSVAFSLRGQRVADGIAGGEAGTWAMPPNGFDRIDVTSPTAQTVTIFTADGTSGVDRVVGEVAVIDGGTERAIAGTAFTGYGSQPAVAAQYSHVQLWNPAGSGRVLVVTQIKAHVSAAGTAVYLCDHNAALGTAQPNPASKSFGVGAPVSLCKSTTNAAVLGTPIDAMALGVANDTKVFPLSHAIIVTPGRGIMVVTNVVNLNLTASFEFDERAP